MPDNSVSTLVPVDHDPFVAIPSFGGVRLVPVDHDPFTSFSPNLLDQAKTVLSEPGQAPVPPGLPDPVRRAVGLGRGVAEGEMLPERVNPAVADLWDTESRAAWGHAPRDEALDLQLWQGRGQDKPQPISYRIIQVDHNPFVGTQVQAQHEPRYEPHLLPQYDALGTMRPLGPGEYILNWEKPHSWSSERTVTVQDPSLNDDRPTVVPSLWLKNGIPIEVSEDEAAQLAAQSGLRFPSFSTILQAERFANRREKNWQRIKPEDSGSVEPLWTRPQ